MKKLLYTISLMFLGMSMTQGQSNQSSQSSNLENAEVVIEKESSFELPIMSREYGKIEKIKRKNQRIPQEYELELITLDVEDSLPKQLPAVLDNREEKKFYDKYVRAGLGNYLTPYLEAGINNNRNPDFDYGLKLYHKSSQEGSVYKKLSAESHNSFDAFGTYYSDYGQSKVGLNYNRIGTHFYGFEGDETLVTQDSIKQIIQNISFNASHEMPAYLTGNSYSLKGGLLFDYTFDHFDASEFQVGIDISGDYHLDEESKISGFVEGAYNQYKNTTTTAVEVSENRSWAKFGGNYQTRIDEWYVKAGVQMAYSADSNSNDKGFYFYPDVMVEYTITEDELAAFLQVKGGLKMVQYKTLSELNPWLSNDVNLLHENNIVDIEAGVDAILLESIGIRGTLGYSISQNMGFLVNDPNDVSKFLMLYATDGNTGVFKMDIAGTWTKREWTVKAEAKVNAYSVSDSTVQKAYHRPVSENSVTVSYKYLSNWTFGAVIYNKIGITALEIDPTTGVRSDVSLPVIFDMNLTAQYKINDNFGAFALVNNLFSQKYENYYRYNVKGFQLLAGVSYRF
ncbi:TonB-dependent receptor [Flammeovirga agarivorans]|uniref:TonB-dependent receptor n=1 Tax=Flammeovirga agarivorans TaxID=2726742 RepID=A0A7X8XWN0_9BACT|nr:TonB-dependent receptor [Flammeovirga agarivorans]NLR92270.1 TonB-dependent receptor [Flammeovirga agarivorans]